MAEMKRMAQKKGEGVAERTEEEDKKIFGYRCDPRVLMPGLIINVLFVFRLHFKQHLFCFF